MNARSLVLDCVYPVEPGESRQSALLKAARNSGLSYARVLAFFYNKGNPPPEAWEKLEAAAGAMRRAANDTLMDHRLAAMTAEYQRLKADVDRLDREIAATRRARAHGDWEAPLGAGPEN
jgi:septal ring factor EnvC (AmiA/AmiB activator)